MAVERAVHAANQSEAPPETVVFAIQSIEFGLDRSIAPEVRTLIRALYDLAGAAAAQTPNGLKRLGTEPFEVATDYDELFELTGWRDAKVARVFAAAGKLITRLGSKRGGYRYRVNLIMRTYRRDASLPIAPSVFRENRPQPEDPKKPRQLSLGSSAPAIEAKLSTPMAGAKNKFMAPTIEAKDTALAPAIEAENRRSNVRAGDESQDVRDNSNEQLREQLLLLFKKQDPTATLDSLPFQTSVEALIDRVVAIRSCDRAAAAELLAQIVAEPAWRGKSFSNPLGYIRQNLPQLLRLRSATPLKPATDAEAFFALAVPKRADLILAQAAGRGPRWLGDHQVSTAAGRYARRLLQRDASLAGRIATGDLSSIEGSSS